MRLTTSLKRKIQLFATMMSLSLSLTSFLYLSYAWFTSQRVYQTHIMEITTEGDLEYAIKFFDGNYNTRDIATGTNSGYQSPTAVADPSERLGVADYQSDFDLVTPEMIAPGSSGNPLLIADIYPGIQYTFAVEVTSELATERQVEFILKEFTALGESDTLDSATNEPIALSSAINIYTTAIATQGMNDAQVTAAAHAFVQDLAPVDRFDDDSQGGLVYIPLVESPLAPVEGDDTNKVIFLFTIKFSDSADSYYRWVSYSNGINYYEKSPLGNSNVYQAKSFTINEFLVYVKQ
ncbi:MAG: hypothetical protein WC399_04075 [Bacilli bacterium]|jgi:hypothetical protein